MRQNFARETTGSEHDTYTSIVDEATATGHVIDAGCNDTIHVTSGMLAYTKNVDGKDFVIFGKIDDFKSGIYKSRDGTKIVQFYKKNDSGVHVAKFFVMLDKSMSERIATTPLSRIPAKGMSGFQPTW